MSKEKHLLEEYAPLVHKIASGFQRKLPRNVLREDLIAAGMSGLWDAIRRHPDGGDESFEWYVRVRIRGAILDELRAQDWLPRRMRESDSMAAATTIVREGDLTDLEQQHLLFFSNVEELLDNRRQLQQIFSYVDDLPAREFYIVTQHYFRDVKFKDLAVELGISEPRISQLHSRAIARLRQYKEEQEHGTNTGAPPESTRRRRLRVSHQ